MVLRLLNFPIKRIACLTHRRVSDNTTNGISETESRIRVLAAEMHFASRKERVIANEVSEM